MIVQYLMLLFLSVVLANDGQNSKTDPIKGFNHLYSKQENTRERELANRLLHRLMDVAYETFKDMGGSDVELKEIQRKRARITTCYFQAIACY